DLARLPVDPAIGRMIIQAVKERALSELLVIAAGLSIQDARERPLDQKEAAEQAHRRFLHPESDFLSLLKIWNAYHDEFERLRTQNQMRRFCKSHFISYLRMREWTDVHEQLEESLETVDFTSIGETLTTIQAPQRPDPERPIDPPLYAAIHRCVLSGLLTHIAQRREKNLYCATGNREVMVFPGSNLFDKNAGQQKSPDPKQRRNEPKTFQPSWIVAGEIVETSRLYARSIAAIQPQWVVELGEHICKFTYQGPFWSPEQGRVLVTEKVLLGGLELLARLVPHSKVNPKEATSIFIRAALVEEPLPGTHRFLQQNQALREKIENWQTRSRTAALPDLDETFYRFYSTRLANVSSVHDLNRFIKENGKGDPDFLSAREEDLIGDRKLALDAEAFPESIELAGQKISLQYAYAPGEPHDGVTAKIPVTLMQHIKPGTLEWAVPGWREEQIRSLLKALPKSLRVPLMPLEPKVAEISAELNTSSQSLLQALSEFIRRKYRVNVSAESWAPDALPDYLKPRFEILGTENKTLAASRDLPSLQQKVQAAEKSAETETWEQAAAQWERYQLEAWDFGDLPGQIEIPTRSGVPLLGYPALQLEDGDVSLRLLRNRAEAIRQSQPGLSRLAELAFQRDLAWLEKDLKALNPVKDLYITLGSSDELLETAFLNIKQFLFEHPPVYPLTKAAYDETVAQAKERLPGHLPQFVDRVTQILRLRQEILLSKKQYPGMLQDLKTLLPSRFLASVPWPRLREYPRYLKAILVRAERAAVNPLKDAEKARQISPFAQQHAKFSQKPGLSAEQFSVLAELRWLIEELKVSLYAQELGTALPISTQRLARFVEEKRLNC
ncbi:MAG TPA: DUF3418 domain-containing protein, partial [Verrucomicrobiae bacterium]|nr:DUF3418 domain-containing protein [Verrucomicrobiae bacterium]